MNKKSLEYLTNEFERLRLESMKLNEQINKNKNYWSRSMLWAQTKLSRKLARQRNQIKTEIELHKNMDKRVSDSANGWRPKNK